MDSLSSVTQITVRTMRDFLKMGNHSETKLYYSIIDVGTHHNSKRGNEIYQNFKLGIGVQAAAAWGAQWAKLGGHPV